MSNATMTTTTTAAATEQQATSAKRRTDKARRWVSIPDDWGISWGEEAFAVGDVAFLIERCDHNRGGGSHFYLSLTPPRTNQSYQLRFEGWCGSYNNVSTYGHGVVRVARLAAKNPARAEVVALTGADEANALEALGYTLDQVDN